MDQNWLVFVRAENDLFLVCGSTDLFLCEWSKLTWFLYVGRKSLGFSVSIEIDLDYVWVEMDLISVWGMEHDLISEQGWIDLVVVWVIATILTSV